MEGSLELLDKLEGMKFSVQLDNQSVEAVKSIDYEFFANEKKFIVILIVLLVMPD